MGWDWGGGRGERRLHNYDETDVKEGGRKHLHAISLMRTLNMIRPRPKKQRSELKLPGALISCSSSAPNDPFPLCSGVSTS